jgi:hypothetical protein
VRAPRTGVSDGEQRDALLQRVGIGRDQVEFRRQGYAPTRLATPRHNGASVPIPKFASVCRDL